MIAHSSFSYNMMEIRQEKFYYIEDKAIALAAYSQYRGSSYGYKTVRLDLRNHKEPIRKSLSMKNQCCKIIGMKK